MSAVRRRRLVQEPARVEEPAERVVVPHDPVNESAILAAAAADPAILEKLWRKIRPDQFAVREHADGWTALVELRRRGLGYDPVVVSKISGGSTARHLEQLLEQRPTAPSNIDWHVATLFWDAARIGAARGSVPQFLEALRDPKAEPERVRGLARAVAASFDGYQDRKYLHDPGQLVLEQMREVEERVSGRACYPYGIEGLDWFDKEIDGLRRRRVIPGAAPGQVTVVTGISGGGKSTLTAHIALGLAGWDPLAQSWSSDNAPRRVLYGAWEMRGGMTLELMSCISLGWSRSDLMEGLGPIATHEGRVILETRMHEVSKRVRFMANPFRRDRGEKGGAVGNERNLDLVQGYISDAGCDVFIADLWKRCLRDASPEAEEDALVRQQAMLEDLHVHGILLQQQRLKDIEQRADKRPTREGIKGSSAWIEVADTILAPHRPSLFKRMDDTTLELFILKQRYGKWPLGVEFVWNADTGSISGGRSIEYDRPGEVNELDGSAGDFMAAKNNSRRRRQS